MEKIKKILLVDQDDVLADFMGAFWIALKKNPAIKYPQSQYKFFENLEPIKDAIESINILKNYYDVLILTRPSVHNPLCYTEKRVWIENHLGFDMCKNLMLVYDKTMIKGDGINKIYLIDDVIHSGRNNPEWEHIHFGSEKFKDWKVVTDYLLKELKIHNHKTVEDFALEYVSKNYYPINSIDELKGEMLSVYNAIIYSKRIVKATE